MTTDEQHMSGTQTDLAAFDGLKPLAKRLAQLEAELDGIGAQGRDPIVRQARKLRKQIREFEPSVTFIGQVKAGKTTLVNSLVGWPDLLPADVNPWTSVVTSLHLHPQLRSGERRSSFRFFTNEEWDHLIRQGGRVGEIASRAGAENELEKVRAQLDEMREKSKQRLGRRFQMLLGQTHDYETFDAGLIQRYVCLGDDFWEEAGGTREQGRFADITKSADLWFSSKLPMNVCVQDTPGVNDTFMIREQITINAMRGSKLCVMVLSAQQALSAVDLGLIRLISNVKSRDVIIFVNRIDELQNPAKEVPEIHESITQTLKKFDGPTDAEVIFGSGYWAGHAVAGTFDQLGEESAGALMNWAEAHVEDAQMEGDPRSIIWRLSGVPALGAAIAARVEAGVGAKLEESVGAAMANLQAGLSAQSVHQGVDAFEFQPVTIAPEKIMDAFHNIEGQALAQLDAMLGKVGEAFTKRADNAQRTFLTRATGSLVAHLKAKGEDEVWTYDPSGLRMLLRSAYRVYTQSSGKAAQEALGRATEDINALFGKVFGLGEDGPKITAPPVPGAQAPVGLGQTIALDLRGSWWMRFWRRRRGYDAFADDFAKLIHEETVPIVQALHRECAEPYTETLRRALVEFVQAQRDVVLGATQASTDPPQRPRSEGVQIRRVV